MLQAQVKGYWRLLLSAIRRDEAVPWYVIPADMRADITLAAGRVFVTSKFQRPYRQGCYCESRCDHQHRISRVALLCNTSLRDLQGYRQEGKPVYHGTLASLDHPLLGHDGAVGAAGQQTAGHLEAASARDSVPVPRHPSVQRIQPGLHEV